MSSEQQDPRHAPVLSSLPADPGDRQRALAVVALSALLFVVLVPFARTPLGVAATFIPIYQTALVVNDVITATLLFGQLKVLHSRRLTVIACGYLFTALMAGAHMLSFPGAFSPDGLLGAGAQSTAYLFVLWHTGFPLFVAAYAVLDEAPVRSVAVVIGATILAALGLVALATAGHDLLPSIMHGNQYADAFNVARHGQWVVTAAALAVLLRRRPYSVLDLWLLVTLSAWFFEIALVAIFNAGRYDLGFYAGRIYGLLASSFVLIVLLTQQSRLYADLVKARQTALSEADLRASRDVLSLAMRGGRMGAWHRDIAEDRTWWSHELDEIFGLAPGQGPTNRAAFYEYVHPDDRASLMAGVDRAVAAREDYALEFRFRHASGEWRWMDLRGRPAYAADGTALYVHGVGIDITERKRTEEAARQSEARFRTMIDGMPQLAWMARPDGWIYWYNRRWYEYTGTGEKEMEGWGWQSLHDPRTLPSVLEAWKKSIATGEPFEMVFPLRGADGRFRPFLTRVSPLRDSSGSVLHWFGTNTDISTQLEAEEALRQADRRKDEFLATLAHELRNPLAPIRSGVELLARIPGLPEQVEFVRVILDRQSRHLARLVDDLLEVSRITQGKVQLRKEPISLTRALHDALEAARPALDAARHEVSIDVPEEDSLETLADPTRMTQVFLNLLNNAIKFTPRGGKIWVAAERKDASAVISVRDTGIGIPPEHLPRVFEMFSQVAPALERAESGLGIGLALVRGLVELHGGSIEAQSAGAGKGAQFVVRIPLAARPAERAAAEARLAATVTPRRVLIVDDNLDAAGSLRRLLELSGHEVHEAHDGVEGVHAALHLKPDVVLLDIGMPRMNGYDAAREIRRREEGRRLRIVALTGWGHEPDRQRAEQAGFDLHLTKPVDPAVLEQVLAGLSRELDAGSR